MSRSPKGVIGKTLATLSTLMVAVLLLFAGFVSRFKVVTVAVFCRLPVVDASISTSEIVTAPPLAIVPSAQVIVDTPLQFPVVAVADVNVVPGGMTSVTTTPFADAGPALVTTMV